jgi:hypothetical protein
MAVVIDIPSLAVTVDTSHTIALWQLFVASQDLQKISDNEKN